ncbi:MAG: RNA polymerase sigma factor [Oscillospiraceae bacterium]|nr:RNA polymerase sigma factor [Oscillospiraceae bacterium]
MDDDMIIELFWQRSENAVTAAADKYSKYCHAISYNILNNNEDAEECVNDTYLKAWNAIPPARPDNLAVFLGTITRRLSLNRYKKNHAVKYGRGQTAIALTELEEVIPDAATSLDENMNAEIVTSVINRFLAKLPKKQRTVFVRRYWHICSIEEIADDYSLSAENVKQILFRARKKLRLILEKEGILV